MQLKSLQMFLAVAEYASFVQAAKHMHTVQSNITSHIQKLEQELGVKLFERATVSLTAAGSTLYPYAQALLSTHDQAVVALAPNAVPSGKLRVGSMETTAALHLAPLLAHFHAQYPSVELALTTAPTAQLTQALLSGELDCVLVAGRLASPALVQRPVFKEELVLVSARALNKLPSAQELLGISFLVFRQGCSYRQSVERWLNEQGVQATRMLEFGSLDALLGCVAAGMGYALLPKRLIEQQSRFVLFTHPIDAHIALVPTYLAAGPEAGHSAALREFIALFADAV